jgi:acyl-coenzyme A synthetase/AMP-(fatty) acid ligase
MVRLIALIWTAAALLQAMSLALRVRDADWGWAFWLSLVLLAFWICGAAAYWLVARRQAAASPRQAPAP